MRRGTEEKWGTGSSGGFTFGTSSQNGLFTPRRDSTPGMTFGIDSSGSASGAPFGIDSRGNATFGIDSRGSAIGGRSRSSVMGTSSDLFGSSRSPSHTAGGRAPIRSGTTTREPPPPTFPSHSLRDSPFMRAPPQPVATSSSATTRNSSVVPSPSPFAIEVTPMRNAQPPPSTAKDSTRNDQQVVEEYKEGETGHQQTPYKPFASSLTSPTLVPLDFASASPHSQAAPTGLGYSARPDPCCVTVFGFVPGQAERILARFHSLGEIILREEGQIESEMMATVTHATAAAAKTYGSALKANWMHLTYRNSVSASMALALNGRVIEGVMIGVKPRLISEGEVDGLDGRGASLTRRGRHARHTPARGTSIFERTTGNGLLAAAAASSQASSSSSSSAASSNSSSSLLLTADSIYATPRRSTHPDALRKNPCTKLMEYLFNY